MIQREERLANVERIARVQDYKKKQINDKIRFDTEKANTVQAEKAKLLDMRLTVRREADRQK